MLLVVTYNKQYRCVWQILDKDYKVVREFYNRQYALQYMEGLQKNG